MNKSGAWLPSERVRVAAAATLDEVEAERASLHEKTRARWRWAWLRGRYDDSREKYWVNLHDLRRERVARALHRLTDAAPGSVFVTAGDFQWIAHHYGQD